MSKYSVKVTENCNSLCTVIIIHQYRGMDVEIFKGFAEKNG